MVLPGVPWGRPVTRATNKTERWDIDRYRREILGERSGPSVPITTAPPPKQARKRPKHTRGEMNLTEQAYDEHLRLLQLVGEIEDRRFEAIDIEIVPPAGETRALRKVVDFLVVLPGGRCELHEVKGTKDGRPYFEEDDMPKLKMLAMRFPWWPLYVVWRVEGHWQRQKIGGVG